MRSINLGNLYTSSLAHLLCLLFIVFYALTADSALYQVVKRHNPGSKLKISSPHKFSFTFISSTS